MLIIPFETTTKPLLHLQESGFHLMMQQHQQAAAPTGTLVMIFFGFRVFFLAVVALDSGGSGDVVFSVTKTQHLPLLLQKHTHTHTLSLSLSLSLSLAGIQLPWHYLFNCLLNCTHLHRQTPTLALLVSEIRVWDRVCPAPQEGGLRRRWKASKQAQDLTIHSTTIWQQTDRHILQKLH